MNIVIPMAGRGQRFIDGGYQVPKPFIPVRGIPMIVRVVQNLQHRDGRFIFLCLSDFLSHFGAEFRKLMDAHCDYRIISVDKTTDGAACTVLLSKDLVNNPQELIIANCDQLVLDPGFASESISFYRDRFADGGILCFLNDEHKWSYVLLHSGLVTRVAEKQVISNIATVGIYYFGHGTDFVKSAEMMISNNDRSDGEFYVAPVYNYLIQDGGRVVPYMVNRMVGLGTPEDLERYEGGNS